MEKTYLHFHVHSSYHSQDMETAHVLINRCLIEEGVKCVYTHTHMYIHIYMHICTYTK